MTTPIRVAYNPAFDLRVEGTGPLGSSSRCFWNYADDGPGPVVVLIHGFPMDLSVWESQRETIGSVYRVITPDLRGFGRTAAPSGIYAIDDMADDVIDLLDALEVTEPVALGGLSMGGYLALSIAIRHPKRLRGLMLINTRAGADKPETARVREDLAAQVERSGDVEPVVASMLPGLFAPTTRERRPEVISQLHEAMSRTPALGVIGALRGMATRPDRRSELGRIAIPTMVMAGAHDALIPTSESELMAREIPNSELVIVPDARPPRPVGKPGVRAERGDAAVPGLARMRWPRGHGCRLLPWLPLLMSFGCGTSTTPDRAHPRLALPGPASKSSPFVLSRTSGSPSPVAEIRWGGPLAHGTVAVRWSDGRFVVARVDGSSAPRSDSPEDARPVLALAPIGPARLVTGDASGLTVWNVAGDPAVLISKLACGPITSLAAEGDAARGVGVIAAMADGSLGRFLISDDRIDGPTTSIRLGVSSHAARMIPTPSRREVVAIAAEGSSWTVRGDLTGTPHASGSARDLSFSSDGSLVARLRDGPRVDLSSSQGRGPSRTFFPSRAATSVALCERAGWLFVGSDSVVFAMSPTTGAGFRASSVMEISGQSGPFVVSAAPEGDEVAIGDGSGKVEVMKAAILAARGRPIRRDDDAALAFEPHLRFYRPRGDDREAFAPITKDLDEVRARLDAGELAGLATTLRDMEDNPSLPPSAMGEVRALRAALEQRNGGSDSLILMRLDAARSAFAREGRTDREADIEFWMGRIAIGPFDASSRGASSSGDAVGHLRRAATLYRSGPDPNPRQASLCDAARAWALLDGGDLRGAMATILSAIEAARVDPVLGRVPEIDRIAAAIASAKGDWSRSAAADARAIENVTDPDRSPIRREAALSRAGALAALGRWNEASETLGDESLKDPEWTIRRAVCRVKAGLPVSVPSGPEDDPIAAHVRAILAMNLRGERPDRPIDDLARAEEGHRRSGREDLAIEAALARAEALERSGRAKEARAGHEDVARRIRSLGPIDLARRGSRPILEARDRAFRGLARAEIADSRPERALEALNAASENPFGSEELVGTTLGLSAAQFPLAEEYRDARADLERRGGPGSGPGADAALLATRRLRTSLAGHGRAGDDLGALGLAAGEAVLTIAAIGPNSVAGVLVRAEGETSAAILPIARGDLDSAVALWRSRLENAGKSPMIGRSASPSAILALDTEPDAAIPATAGGADRPAEARLFEAIFTPFLPRIKGVSRLFVVPGAGLASIPLDALGQDARFRETVAVTYLPCSSFLPSLRDEARIARPADLKALVVSAFSVRDMAATLRTSGWFVEGLAGPDATANRLRFEPLGRYAAIEIQADWLGPSRSILGESALRLTAPETGRPGDGEITLRDIATLPMRARVLVVRPIEGDPPPTDFAREIGRAGLLAGADAVVVALWKSPPESSSAFLGAFYRSMSGGSNAREAFFQARASLARDPRFRDPIHRAAYAYYGP